MRGVWDPWARWTGGTVRGFTGVFKWRQCGARRGSKDRLSFKLSVLVSQGALVPLWCPGGARLEGEDAQRRSSPSFFRRCRTPQEGTTRADPRWTPAAVRATPWPAFFFPFSASFARSFCFSACACARPASWPSCSFACYRARRAQARRLAVPIGRWGSRRPLRPIGARHPLRERGQAPPRLCSPRGGMSPSLSVRVVAVPPSRCAAR